MAKMHNKKYIKPTVEEIQIKILQTILMVAEECSDWCKESSSTRSKRLWSFIRGCWKAFIQLFVAQHQLKLLQHFQNPVTPLPSTTWIFSRTYPQKELKRTIVWFHLQIFRCSKYIQHFALNPQISDFFWSRIFPENRKN